MPMFCVIHASHRSKARVSILTTRHGKIHGPFFMPIATRGAVKNVSSDELKDLGAEIILSNTYHLLLHPGKDVIKIFHGLHNFMRWSGPILTDSGGYQVFSLSQHRKISEDGVTFKDPQNGRTYVLRPEDVIDIQTVIGSDIMMVLDDCTTYPTTRRQAEYSMNLTLRWAQRSLKALKNIEKRKNIGAREKMLFGIVQGSVFKDLRVLCARELASMPFDGYAVGGVAVGEPRDTMKSVIKWVVPHLPKTKPRYLMGVGRPEEIVDAVRLGMDMFDCVIPTREARHGRLYIWNKNVRFETWLLKKSKTLFYTTLDIKKSILKKSKNEIYPEDCGYTFSYLHHLFRTKEGLGLRLATLHNLWFYLELMRKIREAIKSNNL